MTDPPRPPLERLAYSVSHDLGAPVRHINQFLSLLKPRLGPLDERGAQYLARIEAAGGRLEQQLQDVLRFSRILSRGAPPVLTDALEAFDAASLRLRPRLTACGATVTSEGLGEVFADPEQLTELITELIRNASEFVASGTAPVVAVRGHPTASGCRIEVHDNGIGVGEHVGRDIFALWRRSHPAGTYAGRGVGLALCELIVERHGGTIGYESAPGGGTCFWFELPSPGSAVRPAP